tara:strand:- start:160 stop:831 length:672 start_codon:yes stop_codon:yes gene_type:complete
MEFTFGIITGGNLDIRVINSIYLQNIPSNKFEIIIVGGEHLPEFPDIKHIDFDESVRPMWITRKKNMITRNAKFENIVFLHDYYFLWKSWYDGFLKFGNKWDICMNKILNQDGSRFRDWIICYDREFEDRDFSLSEVRRGKSTRYLPSYDYTKTKNMYISGGYWVAKKYVMENEPLNENLMWEQGEDYEWSERVLWNEKYKYKMNTYSTVQTLKNKRLSAETL